MHVFVSANVKQDRITEIFLLASKVNLFSLNGSNQFIVIICIILFFPCTLVDIDSGSVDKNTKRSSTVIMNIVVFSFSRYLYPFIYTSLVGLGYVITVFTFLTSSFAFACMKG